MASTHRLLSPLEQTSVAIDLETTGLRAESDAILEVGAVRFRGDEVLDTFQTFVNPGRDIPEFVQRYTGITPQDIRRAPSFPEIRDDLAGFIGRDPIVGHSVNFDLGFLESHGLPLLNPAFDTLDLATVFLPFPAPLLAGLAHRRAGHQARSSFPRRREPERPAQPPRCLRRHSSQGVVRKATPHRFGAGRRPPGLHDRLGPEKQLALYPVLSGI